MANRPYVSAADISRLFHQPIRRRLPAWPLISACFLIVVGVYFFSNAQAVSQQLLYSWRNDIGPTDLLPRLIVSDNNQVRPVVVIAPPKAAEPAFDLHKLTDNTLYIPKINAKAPIIWDVSNGGDLSTDMLQALRRGVARYPQTALPDQVGNIFLTGHSSNYWWDPGRYRTIFVLLNRLVAGDLVYIKYEDRLYTYKVNGQKTVAPSETGVLAPTATPTLSLMTCTPTGTTLFRRVVTADLISPQDGLKPQPTRPDVSTPLLSS